MKRFFLAALAGLALTSCDKEIIKPESSIIGSCLHCFLLDGMENNIENKQKYNI